MALTGLIRQIQRGLLASSFRAIFLLQTRTQISSKRVSELESEIRRMRALVLLAWLVPKLAEPTLMKAFLRLRSNQVRILSPARAAKGRRELRRLMGLQLVDAFVHRRVVGLKTTAFLTLAIHFPN